MYAVVLFIASDEVEVIPSNWVFEDKAVWPPWRSSTAVSRAVRERLRPDCENWISYNVRVLCRCETYEEGRKKAKLAEDTSDLQTETEEDGTLKHKTRKRRKPVSWSSSSDEEEAPAPARSPSVSALPPPSVSATVRPPPVSAPPLPVSAPARPPSVSAPARPRPPAPQIAPCPPDQLLENARADVTARAILKAVSEVQVSLREVVREQTSQHKLLHHIWQKICSSSDVGEDEPDVTLPLKSLSEVEDIEEKLKDAAFMKSLVNHFSKIGGADVKEAVRRVMTSSLDHSVVLKYNWGGKIGWKGNGDSKLAFSKLALCMAVTKAVMKTVNSTKSATEREIMVWLRNARDRHGGRKQREQRQQQEAVEAHR